MTRAPRGGIWFAGRFYKGGQFLPKAARQRPPQAILDDETLIQIALSEMPVSSEYAVSMHRYLRGSHSQRDVRVLDGRRLEAIQRLRDGARTDGEWRKWSDRYIQVARGVM